MEKGRRKLSGGAELFYYFAWAIDYPGVCICQNPSNSTSDLCILPYIIILPFKEREKIPNTKDCVGNGGISDIRKGGILRWKDTPTWSSCQW